MDPTKPSLSSKATTSFNEGRGGDVTQPEEVVEQWRNGGEGERQREVDREAGVTDGLTLAAETTTNHRVSADKRRFNTVGYHRKLKQKVVADYTTGAGQLDALKRALEVFPVPVCLNRSWGEEGTGPTLENNWTDIVHNHSMMCKTQRQQQEALWELVHTELTYINKLTVVTDLVMAALTNLHQHGFLLEVTPESLFSNLPSILSAHRLFWQEVMYPMLQEVRRTGKPFDPMGLEAGCLQFPERFSTYLHYCWKEESTVEFTSKLTDTNLHFHTYLMWVETHPQCERMRLGDMQAKPIQRITKYPLLLKAVLKTTQAPHTQHTLSGMLACVNGFLHSINDFLRLKDDELALSLSAQKIEGYDVMEGMSEEIEKHVREFCSFDLTCPVRGVGPGVIRKLLLEETLKIRGRKDHKLEVTALLFSDVLLVTKVQKKAERLKVVRPPLALDRTRCNTLKDGCSFVVVEVSVLGCATNVYTFSTSSPESCSTWVFTIHEAQETLQGLRETEASRRLQTKQRDLQLQEQATPPTEPKMTIEESVDQPPDQSEAEITSSLEVKPVEELLIQSVNGALVSIATEAEQQTQEPVDYKDAMLPGQPRKLSDIHNQSVFQPQPKPNGPHNLLLGGYPDIDYDIDYHQHQSSTLPLSPCRENNRKVSIAICQMESQGLLSQGGRAKSTRRNSAPQSVEQQAMRNLWLTQSGEEEALAESLRFSRKLNSPRLRRRRPINTEQTAAPQMSQSGSDSSGMAQSVPRTNSSSNSDSDCKQKLRGSYQHNSGSSGQSSDSHLVLKLGSLKMNRGVFWDMPAEKEFSPEPHAFSDPELPKDIPEEKDNTPKRPKLKTQRSASIPDIILQEGYSSLLTSAKPSNARIAHSPPPGLDPYLHPSPLESILNRAKERRKDGGRREGKGKSPTFRTWALPPSPSFSTTLSQSPSEGDRETEWEEVELVRRLAPSVNQGWIEERVDGDEEEEKKSSPAFPDSASVDWPGWCFEADEVLDQLTPEDSGVGVDEEWWEAAEVGLSQTLTLRDFQRIGTHEDGTISQV
ncbi:pleckstrin homology domain-containing family G member 6 isoform X2 [Salmo salar]|uniref:Pleckstrin homology domain-containing family G member 6 isoform X2 n=1 Tax=Salmo salar TaxID=8030 RepID=A0ABM3EUJ2_SALSA|nr:pleckstrin homology domain-containing family G member 6 isoform X2 [Salmo salar]